MGLGGRWRQISANLKPEFFTGHARMYVVV